MCEINVMFRTVSGNEGTEKPSSILSLVMYMVKYRDEYFPFSQSNNGTCIKLTFEFDDISIHLLNSIEINFPRITITQNIYLFLILRRFMCENT